MYDIEYVIKICKQVFILTMWTVVLRLLCVRKMCEDTTILKTITIEYNQIKGCLSLQEIVALVQCETFLSSNKLFEEVNKNIE